MSASPLEAVVRHDGRLDILCCLVAEGPLTTPQLSGRLGKPLHNILGWVKLLECFRVVKRTGKYAKGRLPLYEANLDEHPDWVREAVEEHRRS